MASTRIVLNKVHYTPEEFLSSSLSSESDYDLVRIVREPIIVEPVFKFKVVDLNESELAKCNTIEEGVKIFLERRPYFTKEHAELFVEKL